MFFGMECNKPWLGYLLPIRETPHFRAVLLPKQLELIRKSSFGLVDPLQKVFVSLAPGTVGC